jgi:hypothetical protein
MNDEPWQPTDAAIAEVLAKYTPRQIAIAYLRAKRRARQAETAFQAMDEITAATESVRRGDERSARATLERLSRKLTAQQGWTRHD